MKEILGILVLSAVAMVLSAVAMLGATLSAQAFGDRTKFPLCTDVPVEKRIMRDFNWAEEKTWNRGFTLVRLDNMHEHRTTQLAGSEVARRYCNATAVLSNGHKRQIWYLIEDIGGFAGVNWDVTHCVAGLDPWRNHDGNCRTMR